MNVLVPEPGEETAAVGKSSKHTRTAILQVNLPVRVFHGTAQVHSHINHMSHYSKNKHTHKTLDSMNETH